MTTHAIDTGEHEWGVDSAVTTLFDFDYEAGRDQLLRLYDKGTHKQWIGSERIDWSTEIDPNNPTGLPDEFIAIYGTPWWNGLTDDELERLCSRPPAPGYPEEPRTVGKCLRVVMTEECEHRRYAVRDLALLESRT